jgi:hypothetical protein
LLEAVLGEPFAVPCCNSGLQMPAEIQSAEIDKGFRIASSVPLSGQAFSTIAHEALLPTRSI